LGISGDFSIGLLVRHVKTLRVHVSRHDVDQPVRDDDDLADGLADERGHDLLVFQGAAFDFLLRQILRHPDLVLDLAETWSTTSTSASTVSLRS